MPTSPPTHRNPHSVERQVERERVRNAAKSSRYGRDWQSFRKSYLKEHPLCSMCLKAGVVNEAKDLHHIVKVTVAPHRRLDPSNIMGLCHAHHSTLTGQGH